MKNRLPFVSVIVPAYNESENIGSCIDFLKNQDYPSDNFEIIVVDNGSKDDTANIVRSKSVTLLTLAEGKVGAVRNFGVNNSSGSILAFIDADCLAGPSWISSAVSALEDPKVGAVGGYYLLPLRPTWVERAWVLGQRKGNSKTKALAGGSFVTSRSIFEKLGGFNVNINAGEDSLLSYKVSGLGLELMFLESCSVIHLGYPKNIFDFAKRQVWHSSSYVRSNLGIKDRTFVAVLVFSLLLSCVIVSLLLGYLMASLLFLLLLLTIPAVFTLKRVFYGGYTKIYVKSIFSAMLVDIVYFFSRSIGLVLSFFYEVRRRF